MAFPLLGALSAAGGLASLFGGNKAAKEQRDLQRQQLQIGRQQLGLFNQTAPVYGQAVGEAARSALLEPRDAAGLTAQDRLRFQLAERDLGQQRQQSANRLAFQAKRLGLNAGGAAALQGQNERAYQGQIGDLRHQLFLNAPQMQQQRLQSLLGMLGPGLGGASFASNILGNQAAQAGQQAQSAYGTLGNLAQNYFQDQGMREYMKQYGAGAPQSPVLVPRPNRPIW